MLALRYWCAGQFTRQPTPTQHARQPKNAGVTRLALLSRTLLRTTATTPLVITSLSINQPCYVVVRQQPPAVPKRQSSDHNDERRRTKKGDNGDDGDDDNFEQQQPTANWRDTAHARHNTPRIVVISIVDIVRVVL